jgi:hypothetical protein
MARSIYERRENKFPPASPLVHIHFGAEAPLSARAAAKALVEEHPAILLGRFGHVP